MMDRMRRGLLGFLLLAVTAALVGLPSPAGAFLSDMAGHWAAGMVSALEARGIVAGVAPDVFAPDQPLTRAQWAKLVVAGLGYGDAAAALSGQPSRFVDVPAWHWAAGYIEVLAELGLTAGVGNGAFDPEGPVTRAQLAVFAVRAAGIDPGGGSGAAPYADEAEIPAWAREAVAAARAHGLMEGMPGGRFEPGRPVTRAEGAAVLYRLLAHKGLLYQVSGTLVAFDPNTRRATVRDAAGEARTVRMDRDATYLRQGSLSGPGELRVLDQVWIALDDSGDGLFLEAWQDDAVVERVAVELGRALLLLPDHRWVERPIQPGALISVNGREAPAAAVDGLTSVYVAFDHATGEIRVMAALRHPVSGVLVDPWVDDDLAAVDLGGRVTELTWAEEPVILIDGRRAEVYELRAGDPLLLAFDEDGRIAYVEVNR
nr:MAG: hypothetical protein DIU55_14200 [Bacillota bacterium]